MKYVFTFFMFMLLLSGCGKDSVLDKLKHNTQYPELNMAFWGKQHDRHTVLWDKALHYCDIHAEKINCGPLMMIAIIQNGSQNVPAYGTSSSLIQL